MRALSLAILVLTAAAVLAPTHAAAQVAIAEPPPAEDVSNGGPSGDRFADALGELAGQRRTTPAPPPMEGAGPARGSLGYTATEEMRAALGEALYADYQASLAFNRQVFEWQLQSSRTTFWIVIGLVGVGVAFATIQFAKAMRAPPGADAAGIAEHLTEMELSAKGLKVSSPVLGVIILVISLGFFYLFLVHVYPIEHVRSAQPLASADSPGLSEE